MQLLIGTRKGAFFLDSDKNRRKWTTRGPVLLGQIVNHIVQDPRQLNVFLMAARPGHLGPTLMRSTNSGKTWKESSKPPAFAKAEDGSGRVVKHVFWLTPGHASERGVWYAGTSPQGLFRTEDSGDTWQSVTGFNDHPLRPKWCNDGEEGPPDGATLHSILVDPRDARHMYIGMSSGGMFESTDQGASWAPLNKGCAADFLPDPNAEYGHDPHCVRYSPVNPDRLYMQNHCGVYRLDRPGRLWDRIGMKLPKKIGDIGFGIVVHPRDDQSAWVFPMDGTTVWPRTSPAGKPALYVTRNAGKSWQRQDKGFPTENAHWTVKRQAITGDSESPAGIYLGTTSGEVWASRNEGESWACIGRHLPHIYSVEVARKP
ncbi:MAG: glycosyl hydrolase [Candidatus Solibacter usitatus]|nr:glycosyl hydrolase [Candidatus Solibacter usitatus]